MVEGEEVVYLGRGEKRFYVWRYSLHDAKGGKKEKVVEKRSTLKYRGLSTHQNELMKASSSVMAALAAVAADGGDRWAERSVGAVESEFSSEGISTRIL